MQVSDVPKISAHLLEWNRVYIELDELVPTSVMRNMTVNQRAEIANALREIGFLTPVKASSLVRVGGKMIPRRYRIDITSLNRTDPIKLKRDVNSLDVRIRAKRPSYLIDHPADFVAYRTGLEQLSTWLRSSRAAAPETTRKERSYEIWGDEKALTKMHQGSEMPLGKLLSKALKLDIDKVLNTHDTTSPEFSSYILPSTGFVIVSENKDLFCDFEDLLFTNGSIALFGTQIRGVICGGGWGVCSSEFSSFLNQRHIKTGELLYIGDIDVDGIAMLQKFITDIGGAPFVNLYRLMLKKHSDRISTNRPVNVYSEDQNRIIEWKVLEPYFESEELDVMFGLNEKSIRIPQEIITKPLMEEEMLHGEK